MNRVSVELWRKGPKLTTSVDVQFSSWKGDPVDCFGRNLDTHRGEVNF